MSNDNKLAVATEAPPYPGSVLYLIYGIDGDGALSYEIDNGAVASFWHGQHFDLGGKHYYTGFAYATPNKYGNDDTETVADPGEGVAIGQATFLLTAPGSERPWMLLHAQQYVGSFGGYERADEVDETRKPQHRVLDNGHLLLALPTSSFGNGVASAGFALFTFDPDKSDRGDYQGWVYRGTVAAGEDNEASSDEDGVVPHVSSVGTLGFETVPGEPMPAVRVALSGTVVAGPGRARMLDASDAVVYAYDQASGQYLPKEGA